MQKIYDYKAVARFDMLDPKLRLLNKLNAFAVISIILCCGVGLILNYCFRMIGSPGGMYFIYIVCGLFLCLLYPYAHEYAHAFAIMISVYKMPSVKFKKLVACCGSPNMLFNKAQYLFGALFPFVIYCMILIPMCIFLPPLYFSLPFMPLMYNIFGSIADMILIGYVVRSPKRSKIVDSGTDIVIFIPIMRNCD